MTGYVLAALAAVVVWAISGTVARYLDLLNNREERAYRMTAVRTADVVTIATKAEDVEAALLKHEARICELEMTVAGAPPRRRP